MITLSHGKVNALCVELLDQLHAIALDLTAHTPRVVVVTADATLADGPLTDTQVQQLVELVLGAPGDGGRREALGLPVRELG